MDKQALTILQQLAKKIENIEQQMVIKDDLKAFATKDDLKRVESKLISIEDTMATKDDITNLKKELIEYTDGWCADLLNSVDKNKANTSELQDIKTRVRNLERKVALD